jgi:hypothetical protein
MTRHENPMNVATTMRNVMGRYLHPSGISSRLLEELRFLPSERKGGARCCLW